MSHPKPSPQLFWNEHGKLVTSEELQANGWTLVYSGDDLEGYAASLPPVPSEPVGGDEPLGETDQKSTVADVKTKLARFGKLFGLKE